MTSLKQGSIALLVAGLLTVPAVQADNTAYAFNSDRTFASLIGPLANDITGDSADVYTAGEWYPVLHTELSNAGTPKDLIMGLSFETTLVTTTEVKSKGGTLSKQEADAMIEMKIVVDEGTDNERLADPGEVIFDKRRQALWAQFAGWDCTADTGTGELQEDGTVDTGSGIVTCDLEEVVGLTLDTTASHTFNFLTSNIGSGSHTITAYARLSANGEYAGEGDKNNALLGKGTLSVWEVHGAVVKK